jgi:hypothetical protein
MILTNSAMLTTHIFNACVARFVASFSGCVPEALCFPRLLRQALENYSSDVFFHFKVIL